MRKVLLIWMVLWSACKKNPPQQPTQYLNDGFLEASKKANKTIKEIDYEQIRDFIEQQEEDYIAQSGFYMTPTQGMNPPQDGSEIEYSYQVKNLKEEVIYSFEEIGIQHIIMGQQSMIRAIEYGLKKMGEGESTKLLIPSSLAYGITGDGNKIGTDQPLLVDLKLISVSH